MWNLKKIVLNFWDNFSSISSSHFPVTILTVMGWNTRNIQIKRMTSKLQVIYSEFAIATLNSYKPLMGFNLRKWMWLVDILVKLKQEW